jgi:hypothetical protein
MPATPVKLAMGGDTRRVELRQDSWSLAELLEHIGELCASPMNSTAFC